MYIPEKISNRILQSISGPISNSCIEFNVINRSGYGELQTRIDGKKKHFLAHRVSYQLYYDDDLNSDDIICHKCDNPKCINPAHLFKGSHQDNVADKVSKGRQAKGNKNGRYIDGRASDKMQHNIHNHNRKMSKNMVGIIRMLIDRKWPLSFISDWCSVNLSSVKDISSGRTYKSY